MNSEKQKEFDDLGFEPEQRVATLEKKILELSRIVRTLDSKLRQMDFIPDVRKHYGLNGTKMFYIGIASGNVYSKPINEDILKEIKNISSISSEAAHKINKYFMDIE